MSGNSGSYSYINDTGVIVPDTTSLNTTVNGEWQGVYGQGLSVDPALPQGVMITAETLARANLLKNNAAVANQINPNQAGGTFLDAICSFTGLDRAEETYSTYSGVVLAGQPLTNIPQYTQGETENGDVYQTTEAVELSASGSATVSMTALNAGPVAAPSGTMTPLNVLGLETITMATAGAVGVVQQSDPVLRTLRRISLAAQSAGLNGSIKSNLAKLPGVSSVQFLENNTAEAATISGIAMSANSIWCCVQGGTPAQIAAVIAKGKSQGANWNGAQSVQVTDPITGQVYTVLYDIPTAVPMLIRVTCKQGSYAGSLTSSVTTAVINFGANDVSANLPAGAEDPGIVGFSTGQNVSPFEIAAAITAQLPGVYVNKVEISTVAANSYQTTEVDMAINQIPSVIVANIAIVLGT